LLSCILFCAGAHLILNSGRDIILGEQREVPTMLALAATIVSIAGKLALAWSQYVFGKKADSPMLKANAKNMSADVLLSAGVLAGLGLSMFFKIGVIDSWAALLVGVWVIKSAVGILIETNTELMDGGPGRLYYQMVFDAVHSVEEAGNPHRVRIRRIAGLLDIDIDIEVPGNKTIIEAHWIAYQVENAIKKKIENIYDIVGHVEPAGNLEEESFGLSMDSIKNPKE
jgi:cation diffusion facilitator family transporter